MCLLSDDVASSMLGCLQIQMGPRDTTVPCCVALSLVQAHRFGMSREKNPRGVVIWGGLSIASPVPLFSWVVGDSLIGALRRRSIDPRSAVVRARSHMSLCHPKMSRSARCKITRHDITWSMPSSKFQTAPRHVGIGETPHFLFRFSFHPLAQI